MDQRPNRLIKEKSPYLLQHAHNPVDWFPWSDAAFQKAKAEDKPVFLSIGYSTCHWCHVMAHESFEDKQVADYLNEHFISIKVDREERPDIDHIYMTVCQALTGRGGWPLSVFLTPDKEAFFAGTYFPPKDRGNYPGFLRLLSLIKEEWTQDKNHLLEAATEIRQILSQTSQQEQGGVLDSEVLEQAYRQFEHSFDSVHGGFGKAPKFPSPHQLLFLLAYKDQGKEALPMVIKTLEKMRAGGIYDQLGFGFSRYSVDKKWHVPHFEKMLYDNAMLLWAYAKAYELTGRSEFADTAREIVTYVARDMMSSEGAFYSAEDADSEGVEGKFYVWTYEEVQQLLGEQAELFCDVYDVKRKGNFEEGINVLRQVKNLTDWSKEKKIPVEELKKRLTECREKLFLARAKRVRPHCDDKILYSWNALWIGALALAGRILGEASWLTQAERGMAFLERNLVRSDGRLLARYREGEADYPAYLDDYAFGLWAYIKLYESTWQAEYLVKAKHLAQALKDLFYDQEQGGFYFTGNDQEVLLQRTKEFYDSAMPSGNSMAAYALTKLYRLTQEAQFLAMAEATFQAASAQVKSYPMGYALLLLAWLTFVEEPKQIIVVEKTDRDLQKWHGVLHDALAQNITVLAFSMENEASWKAFSFLDENYFKQPGQAYYCNHYTCEAPVATPMELQQKFL